MGVTFPRATGLGFGLALAAVVGPGPVRAGCLAPADDVVATGTGSGPLWGNDAGTFLFVRRNAAGEAALALQRFGSVPADLEVAGGATGFSAGTQPSRWDAFVAGAVNADDDVAFVATTTAEDDPQTAAVESVARRGVYVRAGSSAYELARTGSASPVRDTADAPVPWGALFDAAPADRADGLVRAVFSGQLAGETDRRLGLFRWNQATPTTVAPALLTGDVAPSGGTFSSIGRLRVNGAGTAAFFGVTTSGAGAPPVPGLFVLGEDGTGARVVRFGAEGDAAPGGGRFALLSDFDIDDAGTVAFAASVEAGAAPSGLFRASPPSFAPERLVAEGDASPLAGGFGSFTAAIVRAAAAGELVFAAPLTDEVVTNGLFALPAGATEPLPLVPLEDVVSIAALGSGRAGYSTRDEIHVVVPSDGTRPGLTDFRIVNLDVRNAVPLKADSIVFEGRVCLPPWDVASPPSLRADAVRNTPAGVLRGAALTKIAEVKVVVSSAPGNEFAFGLAGTDASPLPVYRYNGALQLSEVKVAEDGSAATWRFSGSPGPGSFSIDLYAGSFRLAVKRATIQPSFEAGNFRVALFLRSEDDVREARPDAESWFARDLRIGADEPAFGRGRRVLSRGQGVPGGLVYVDSLRVTRRLAKGSRPASDAVALAGTLRICAGTVPPTVPTLLASLTLGDLRLDAVPLQRVGRSGSSYRHKAPGIELRVDVVRGTFTLRASGVPPLAGLVDPSSAAGNDARLRVGGMSIPFALSIPRVHEVAYPIAMARLPGGRVFTR